VAGLCSRVYDICYNSTRLKEVIVRGLLPSSAMIKDLSQEFGMPISQEDLTDAKLLVISPPPSLYVEDFQSRASILTLEIRTHQEKYLQWRNAMLLKNKVQKARLIQVGVLPSIHIRVPTPASFVHHC
jgi:hypothetical protein